MYGIEGIVCIGALGVALWYRLNRSIAARRERRVACTEVARLESWLHLSAAEPHGSTAPRSDA